MSTIYNPEDVYNLAYHGNADELIIALNQGDNSTNLYRDVTSTTALHVAAGYGHMNCLEILLDNGIDVNIMDSTNNTALNDAAYSGHVNIIECLIDRGIDINNRNGKNKTAMHDAAYNCHMNCVEILLVRGIDIDDDIDSYAPSDELTRTFERNGNEIPDCRPIIIAEVEHRRKRALFDSFINHHIEYQPYIDNISALCYPTGSVQVAKPSVGWIRAEAIRDKYYLDEIFFYLHMHVANCYTNHQPDAILTTSMSNIINNLATNNGNKISTLMTVLTVRLKIYLKPDIM